MAGLVGTYLMLIVVLLAGRVPVVERTLGHDVLMRWHRRLAPWTLVLIAAHGALITFGYAESARTGALHQFGQLLTTYPGILTATVGFVLLVMAGFTSARIAKRRMRYETWWAVHLYTYLALALSFSHQLADRAPCSSATRSRGCSGRGSSSAPPAWCSPTGSCCRSGAARFTSCASPPSSARARESSRSLLEGKRLRLMPIAGGQFIQLRILKRGLWWQAHPYSVSALPDGRFLRVTVKDLGDHSGGLAHSSRAHASRSKAPTAPSPAQRARATAS